MAKQYTLEELRSWTPERRLALYNNAKKLPQGQYIVDLIDNNCLSLSSGGLTNDDPVYLRIVDIIWSKPGRSLAVEASDKGFPALCAVDVLLRAELGDQYSKHNLGTASAGSVVADLMKHLGYRQNGWGHCSAECTAKTALCWTPV